MSSTEPNSPGPDHPTGNDPMSADERLLEWHAVLPGALVGLVILVAASLVGALLDRNLADYDHSAWRYPLFVVVLVGYVSAGFVAGRRAPSGALSNGTVAAILAFGLWVPIRILIWAVRDEHKGLFTGSSPVLRPGQIFGQLVIASGLGMLGGFIGARVVVKRVR